MTELSDLQSKAFRDGGMIRLMDFAVRGLPRSFIPGEQHVDLDWAKELYKPEILQLDELHIHSRWFWSGIIGAALISLVVWPQTIDLWRRLAERRIHRDASGVDAPGLLYELVERHQNDERLTRRPEFQFYVFQSALAVAHAWVHHDQAEHRYHQMPPVPDVLELISRVRKHKGERHVITRFRPPGSLRKYWFEPDPPVLIHKAEMSQVLELAREANQMESLPVDPADLDRAADWISAQNPPNELCHPAALAAAGVTIARDDRCRVLWQQVFARQGIRVPNQGRKPATDTALVIQDCITVANRSKDALHEARYLYYRLLRAVEGWYEDPELIWIRLPFVYRSHVEQSPLWAGSQVRFSVEVHFDAHRTKPELQADSESPNSDKRRKKQGPQATAKRLTTGRKAEQWFEHNYQDLPEFQGVELEDRRDRCEGFDYEGHLADQSKYIEVKALRAGQSKIKLTDQQWKVARLEGDRYFLVVVRDVDTDQPWAEVIQNPAAHLMPQRREIRSPTVTWIVQLG